MIDTLDVSNLGVVYVRMAQDGPEYTRFALTPGTDLTGFPEEIITLCNDLWTPEVIEKYKDSLPFKHLEDANK